MTGKLHSAPQSREDAISSAEDGAPVILHPLVVLNVSDHFSRYAALQNYPQPSTTTDPGVSSIGSAAQSSSAGASSSSGAGASNSNQQQLLHLQQSHQVHRHQNQQTQQVQSQQHNLHQNNSGADGGTPIDAAGNPRVIGILLGNARGRVVEVCHSFEIPVKAGPAEHINVDREFMQTRLEQYRQIFAQYNVVGWYCTGVDLGEEEHRLHTDVFSTLTEAPILLFLNPAACAGARRGGGGGACASSMGFTNMVGSSGNVDGRACAPVFSGGGNRNDLIVALQLETKVVDDEARAVLQPVPHRYASEDSERIAVDHVMRHAVPGGADGTSSTSLHLGTLRRSVSMLRARLQVLVAFLEATVGGTIEVDHALLRQVAGVCARLPALDCDEFARAFADEKSDSQVVTYLSGVTKSLCSLSEAVDMFGRVNTTRPAPAAAGRRRNPFMRA